MCQVSQEKHSWSPIQWKRWAMVLALSCLARIVKDAQSHRSQYEHALGKSKLSFVQQRHLETLFNSNTPCPLLHFSCGKKLHTKFIKQSTSQPRINIQPTLNFRWMCDHLKRFLFFFLQNLSSR